MKLKFVIAAALGLLVIFNLQFVLGILDKVRTALSPLFIGLITAVIFNIPLNFLEKKVFRRLKRKFARPLALGIILIISGGILTGIAFLAAPELKTSLGGLADAVPRLIENSSGGVIDFISKALDRAATELQTRLPQIIELLSVTAAGLVKALAGIFIGVFMLAAKEELLALVKRIGARLPKGLCEKITGFAAVAEKKFGAYLAGQLVEALIFGTACYAVFAILNYPYALLIGVIMGFVNLIPMVGAYIGGAVCFLMIFTASPDKALWFVAIIIALQQIEQITTYPLVVGRNVRLNCFWVLVSITVGGLLFGFSGMFLSIPFTATILAIEERNAARRGELNDKTEVSAP